jgi:hypothetical protein
VISAFCSGGKISGQTVAKVNCGSRIVELELPHEEPDFFRESGHHICFYISLDSHEKTNPDLIFYFENQLDRPRADRARRC